MIDDSALLHADRRYDPVKAREYYLRTRNLKGRRQGSSPPPSVDRRSTSQSPPQSQRRSTSGSKPKLSAARRKELQAQKAALEKRLDRLREVLASLVDEAKKRSGVETKLAKDKNSPEKKENPNRKLTRAEKREKAKEARENYESEKDPTVSQEVKQLEDQVQDVLSQIRAAAADAQRQRSSQIKKPKTADRR